MKALIIGYGVVGKATHEMLLDMGYKDIEIFDIQTPGQVISEGHMAAFICVNAENGRGGQNLDDLKDALSFAKGKTHTVFIRTTITHKSFELLKERYETEHFKIYLMPEFLREKDGYKSSKMLPIITDCKDLDYFGARKDVIVLESKQCCDVKYFSNVFFALKIWYFNKVYDLGGPEVVKTIRELGNIAGTISETGTFVPGPDGKFGYGGKCLPKDIQALKDELYHEDSDFSEVLAQVITDNHFFRLRPQTQKT